MWFRRKRSKAHIHFVPEHRGKRGQRVGERWHVDIYAPDGTLDFVCRPQGYYSGDAAVAAVDRLKGVKVVYGRPVK